MRLGASLVSIIRGSTFYPDLYIPLLEKSTIDDVEIRVTMEQKEIDKLAKLSRCSRLRLWSLHGIDGHDPISSLDEEIRCQAMTKTKWTIELGGLLGVHVVVLHASGEPISDHERSKYIAQAKVSLAELVPIAQRLNVMLAVELLPRTCIGNTTSELEMMLEDLPKDRIGICLDMNHVKKNDSLSGIIHELGSRLITVHISDFDGIDERHWLPGKGIIDWTVVWHALKEIGYDGPWLYESYATHNNPTDNIHMIEDNFRHWRSLSIADIDDSEYNYI